MKQLPPERVWLIVIAVSAAAAAMSFVELALSIVNGDMIIAALSGAALTIFVACAVLAWIIWSKIDIMNRTVYCLQLKKPGLDIVYNEEDDYDSEDEIVPKGKMPSE
jgi:hypothetical protein